MLPNIKLQISVFNPVVADVIATPIANAELDIIAIELSDFIFLLSPTFKSIIAVIITPGIDIYKGEVNPKYCRNCKNCKSYV